MSTARPFSRYTGSGTPSGTNRYGDLLVGVSESNAYASDYAGVKWWNGPDEELGYVIAYQVPSENKSSPLGPIGNVGFFRTNAFDDTEFTNLTKLITGYTPSSSLDAKNYLESNGYWTSWLQTATYSIVLDLSVDRYNSYSNNIWNDLSGNSNNASSIQTPVVVYTDESYFDLDGGSSLGLDNVDSFSISDSVSIDGMSSISVEMYFKIDTVQASPTVLFDKRTASSNGFVGFFNTVGYTFRFGTANPNQVTYTTSPATGVWQHLVVTCGNTGTKVYINGTEVLSSTYSGNFANINTASNLKIGEVSFSNTGTYGFDGKISVLRIYNGVLTQSDVTSRYNTVTSRPKIRQNNLQFWFDAGRYPSYPGTGTVITDLSPNSYTASVVNATFSSASGGFFGFDGSGDYIDTNRSLESESFSVGAWFRTSISGILMILSKETSGGNPWNYRIWLNGGTLVGDISQVVTQSSLTHNGNYNDGNWHFVIFTRDDSNWYLYVDGVQVATKVDNFTGSITNLQEVWIGRSAYLGGSYDFNGQISEIYIYNAVISSSDVSDIFEATKSKYGL